MRERDRRILSSYSTDELMNELERRVYKNKASQNTVEYAVENNFKEAYRVCSLGEVETILKNGEIKPTKNIFTFGMYDEDEYDATYQGEKYQKEGGIFFASPKYMIEPILMDFVECEKITEPRFFLEIDTRAIKDPVTRDQEYSDGAYICYNSIPISALTLIGISYSCQPRYYKTMNIKLSSLSIKNIRDLFEECNSATEAEIVSLYKKGSKDITRFN